MSSGPSNQDAPSANAASTGILRVGWHREHFLSPLLQMHAAQDRLDDSQPDRIRFELVECPGGTGEMQAKLREGAIDVCIALTDALVAGLANAPSLSSTGKPDAPSQAYKIVGRYIQTPLNWAVITGHSSPYSDVKDLRGTTIGISRLGSGSQTMASVMGLREGWTKEEDKLKFKVNGSFKPLRDSVNAPVDSAEHTSAFLWEWFTTKPYRDSGEVRFIGNVETPWPSWLLAAHTSTPATLLRPFLQQLGQYAARFDSSENRSRPGPDGAVGFVSRTFGQQEVDVEEWLKSVRWYGNAAQGEDGTSEAGDNRSMDALERSVLLSTLKHLHLAGVVGERAADGRSWEQVVEDGAFIDRDVCRLI